MVRAIALLVVAAALVTGCAWGRTGRARTLPADRSAPLSYVALGDSTVEGIGASGPTTTYVARVHDRLRAIYPRATATNLGVAGATSLDVVADQLEEAVRQRPHLVTVSVGPNDITGRVPVQDYARNVDTIFRRLTEATSAVVVANLLPDLAVTPRFRGREQQAAVGRLTVQFNDALAAAAARHGVEVVDLYGPSRVEVPARPELIAGDGYHPSDVGYARWAELLWQGVARRIAAR